MQIHLFFENKGLKRSKLFKNFNDDKLDEL